MPEPLFAKRPEDLPDRATMLSMSGLDFMQEVVDGSLPQAPIARLMNFRLVEVSQGGAIFRGAPTFDHLNPMSGVHGGWYGTILDSCLGCAVMTSLPKGRAYTTLEYKVNLMRAIPMGREMIAAAHVTHAGRTTAVAIAELRDSETGRLHAQGNTTCLIINAD